MPDPTCKDCRFWYGPVLTFSGHADLGRCRRHAPTALPRFFSEAEYPPGWNGAAQALFPLTQRDEWCGDFQAVPQVGGGIRDE